MLPSIAGHASKHGIIPLKRYGQNFLFDSTLCDKIVKTSSLKGGEVVLEIGPGPAGLTRSILSRLPISLTVIETDSRCVPLLEEIKAIYPNLNIVLGNALKFDLDELASDKIHIISNLPYQIGTELVIKWLKNIHLVSSMTLMLQKEVVDRMRARPGTKEYGRLSIICQLICSVEKCFDVSSEAFYPPPKVQSSVVKLLPLKAIPMPEILTIVELVTRFAFGERRKMIKTSLKKLTPQIGNLLKTLDIDDSCRAENLSPEQYLSIANFIHQHG